MSHNHTGVDTVAMPGAIAQPDDGDAADAASVNTPFEAHDDALAHLNSRVLTWTMLNGTGYPHKVNINQPHTNTASRWAELTDTTMPVGWLQTDVTTVGGIAFEVTPPHAMARLAHAYVRLNGKHGVGHGADKPDTMPSVLIVSVDDGAVTIHSTTTDPSATVGIYDAPHTVDAVGCDNDPLPCGKTLWVVVRGEAGAHSVASTLALYDIADVWTDEASP
jgi:hypothetical protein